ncbi:MAG: ATP-binding protein [Methylomonas sp.]
MNKQADTAAPPAYQSRYSLLRAIKVFMILGVAFVSLSAGGAVSYYFYKQAEQEYLAGLNDYTHYLTATLEQPLWDMEDQLVETICNGFSTHPEIAVFTIYNEQGQVLCDKHAGQTTTALTRTVELRHNDRVIGRFELGFDSLLLEKRNAQFLIYSLVTTLILVIVLTTLLQIALQRLLHRPLQMLLDRIETFTSGDQVHRVDISGTESREFATILGKFNEMTDTVIAREESLKEANQQLTNYQQHLEKLVQARTAELAVAKEAAEAANHAKGMFLANMSHEIRTPLNAVLGMAQIGLRETINPKAHNAFVHILDSGKLLLTVINDILDYSKIEAGRLEIERIRFNPGEMIDQVVTLNAGVAYDKGLDFCLEEAANLPKTCLGDPLRISQILLNMLTNAVKFTSHGKVELAVSCDNDALCFRVTDSGIGISEGQLQHLFHAFIQADSSTTRRFGGSGLGLTISKRLAELMGGSISVQSQPGIGSSFELRLPLIEPEFGEISPCQANLQVCLAGFESVHIDRLIEGLRSRGVMTTMPESALAALAAFQDECLLLNCEALRQPDILNAVRSALQHGKKILLARTSLQPVDIPEDIRSRVGIAEIPLRPRQIIIMCCQAQAVATPAISTGLRLQGVRILAAEDNPVNQLVLREMLEQEGAILDCVENGLQACDLLRRKGPQAYDIVLTDIQMPVMDGYEAAPKMLAMAPKQPIIGLTAHAMQEERDHCFAVGMVEHVAKPIEIDVLVAAILRHVQVKTDSADEDKRKGTGTPPPSTVFSYPEEMPGLKIDWDGILARFNGKVPFVNKLVDTVLEAHQQTPDQLRALAKTGDMQQLTFIAHSVKGMAGNLLLSDLQALAKQTELAARAGDPTTGDLVEKLACALTQLVAALAAQVASRKS